MNKFLKEVQDKSLVQIETNFKELQDKISSSKSASISASSAMFLVDEFQGRVEQEYVLLTMIAHLSYDDDYGLDCVLSRISDLSADTKFEIRAKQYLLEVVREQLEKEKDNE
jgi:hypothetical protein